MRDLPLEALEITAAASSAVELLRQTAQHVLDRLELALTRRAAEVVVQPIDALGQELEVFRRSRRGERAVDAAGQPLELHCDLAGRAACCERAVDARRQTLDLAHQRIRLLPVGRAALANRRPDLVDRRGERREIGTAELPAHLRDLMVETGDLLGERAHALR